MTRRRLLVSLGAAAGLLALTLPALVNGHDGARLAWYALVGLALGYASGVDLHERRLPNAITYTGAIAALAVAAFAGIPTLLSAAGGAALATALMAGFWWLGRGRLGLGDVKLSAFAGGFLGLGGVAHYLALGTGLGAVAGVSLLLAGRGRRSTLAYGPPLALGIALTAALRGSVLG